jgi:Tfp pilus assembly protein FimT
MKVMKPCRRAATLTELILVLAILVIVAALAVPSLQAMYGHHKLTGAVDSVKGAWAEARAHAMKEGRPYRFAVQPDGSAFRIAPDQDDYWPGEGPANDPAGQGLVLEQSLPTGVRFAVNGEGGATQGNEQENYSLDDKPVQNSNWSSTIVFKPDGTAQEDVRIVFQVKGARTTALQLRGMTGDVSVETE